MLNRQDATTSVSLLRSLCLSSHPLLIIIYTHIIVLYYKFFSLYKAICTHILTSITNFRYKFLSITDFLCHLSKNPLSMTFSSFNTQNIHYYCISFFYQKSQLKKTTTKYYFYNTTSKINLIFLIMSH